MLNLARGRSLSVNWTTPCTVHQFPEITCIHFSKQCGNCMLNYAHPTPIHPWKRGLELAGTTIWAKGLSAQISPPGRPSRKDESTPQGRFPGFVPHDNYGVQSMLVMNNKAVKWAQACAQARPVRSARGLVQ